MNLKKIIMIGGIAAVLGGGAYGALMFLGGDGSVTDNDDGDEPEKKPDPPPKKDEKPKEAPKAGGHGAPAPAAEDDGEPVVAKQVHIVNMPGGKGGFLRCGLSLIVRDPDLGKQLASDKPTPESEEAKAIVLGMLRQLNPEDMNSQDAQDVLRLDIVQKLNDRYGGTPASDKTLPPRVKEPIKDVQIPEWAVQRN